VDEITKCTNTMNAGAAPEDFVVSVSLIDPGNRVGNNRSSLHGAVGNEFPRHIRQGQIASDEAAPRFSVRPDAGLDLMKVARSA
jgi:hypothetical protein